MYWFTYPQKGRLQFNPAGKEVYVDHEKVVIVCESCRVCQHDNDRLAGCTFGAFEKHLEKVFIPREDALSWLSICRLYPLYFHYFSAW
jgi:hypothetical protein